VSNWEKINEEVYYRRDQTIFTLTNADLQQLLKLADLNPRKTVRVCSHLGPDEVVHEMFIVHCRKNWIPIHKHLGREESLSVLLGEAILKIYDDQGSLSKEIVMSMSNKDGHCRYARIPENIYHSLEITSDYFVFQEVTMGPFSRDNLILAPWDKKLTQLGERIGF
jgi:cupin fold WbuC family metalloprotein